MPVITDSRNKIKKKIRIGLVLSYFGSFHRKLLCVTVCHKLKCWFVLYSPQGREFVDIPRNQTSHTGHILTLPRAAVPQIGLVHKPFLTPPWSLPGYTGMNLSLQEQTAERNLVSHFGKITAWSEPRPNRLTLMTRINHINIKDCKQCLAAIILNPAKQKW